MISCFSQCLISVGQYQSHEEKDGQLVPSEQVYRCLQMGLNHTVQSVTFFQVKKKKKPRLLFVTYFCII